MKSLLVSIIISLLLSLDAQARLGETKKQIVERYGEEIQEVPKLVDYNGKGHWGTFFRFNGYLISVMFDRGLSIREAFSRCDGEAISETEMLAFMEPNSGGMKWERLDDKEMANSNCPEWLRSDDHVRAFYNKIWKVFVVSRFVARASQTRIGAAQRGF